MKKNLIRIFTISLFSSALFCANSHADEGEFQYEIKQSPGIIGCGSGEDFSKMMGYAVGKDGVAMQKMVDSGVCFYLIKGKDIYATAGVCVEGKDNGYDIIPFRPRGMKKMVYLPCFATWETPVKAAFGH